MKILVTGGLGFIGHHVVRLLLDREETVSIIDTCTTYGHNCIDPDELEYLLEQRWQHIDQDLPHFEMSVSDTESMDDIIRSQRPDVIIHLASFPRQRVVNNNPSWGSDVMSRGLINLLESASRYGVERFVYVSSSMVYGDFTDGVEEDHVCEPQGQYGILKLAGEWLVRDYSRRTGMEHVIIRPSAVYGPRDVEDRVISRFMISAMQDQPLRVKGADQALDFTYVTDAARGIVAAATRVTCRNMTFNITRGQAVSLADAADMVIATVGSGSVDLEERDTSYPERGALSIDRARVVLGYTPEVDLQQGLELYHAWLRDSVYWTKKTAR
jgi:nucleoside-diphosphate-sugar epimerase